MIKTNNTNEHLNTAKFFDINDKFIDSYDFDSEITDSNTIVNIIKYAYEYNANVYIASRLYYKRLEMIRTIVINDLIKLDIY